MNLTKQIDLNIWNFISYNYNKNVTLECLDISAKIISHYYDTNVFDS